VCKHFGDESEYLPRELKNNTDVEKYVFSDSDEDDFFDDDLI